MYYFLFSKILSLDFYWSNDVFDILLLLLLLPESIM